MQICPFCDQPLQRNEAGACAHCGQELRSLEERGYLAPLQVLAESLQQVALGQMTPMAALESFEHWLGSVQQILNRSARELQESLKKLSRLEGVDSLEILQGFGQIQSRIAGQLDELSELFGGCKTVQEFENRFERMSHLLESCESDLTDLDVFLYQLKASPEGTLEPLPDPIRLALEEIQKALTCLGEFTEERETDHLEHLLEHLDLAREQVQDYLHGVRT